MGISVATARITVPERVCVGARIEDVPSGWSVAMYRKKSICGKRIEFLRVLGFRPRKRGDTAWSHFMGVLYLDPVYTFVTAANERKLVLKDCDMLYLCSCK